ncbi:hypothetical protein [Paenibacillus sp. ATY16]|uniref:hypothetical protein n=1 Tax=Paenibacillus sp. ATY16 TaxID=1759312 RepID=UPI00200E13DB|nr:hypothetical protein [Paenibacillus sp. ATY16]MCK9858199.1 hypothetical protein [Paenibacillus sp. ATY16]
MVKLKKDMIIVTKYFMADLMALGIEATHSYYDHYFGEKVYAYPYSSNLREIIRDLAAEKRKYDNE